MCWPRAAAISGDQWGVTCPLTTYRVAYTTYINSQFPTMSTSALIEMETADVPVTRHAINVVEARSNVHIDVLPRSTADFLDVTVTRPLTTYSYSHCTHQLVNQLQFAHRH